jgi:hypothetical protein
MGHRHGHLRSRSLCFSNIQHFGFDLSHPVLHVLQQSSVHCRQIGRKGNQDRLKTEPEQDGRKDQRLDVPGRLSRDKIEV